MPRFPWLLLVVGPFGCDADDTKSNDLPDVMRPDVVDAPVDTYVPPVRPKVVLLHASPNFPSARFCFATGTNPDGSDAVLVDVPPQPEAGLGRQSAFVLPDIGDLSNVVVPYLIVASKLGNAKCRDALSADGGLVSGGDYQKLPPIGIGTISGNRTLLLPLTGCLGTTFDPQANAARCGSDFSPLLGNLAMRAYELDRATKNGVGAQLAHLSPPTGAVAAALVNAPDASTMFVAPIVTSVRYSELKPSPATAIIIQSVASTRVRIGVLDPDGGANEIASYTFPLALDAGIANGANTTFVLLGDPQSDAGLSVISVQNDPK